MAVQVARPGLEAQINTIIESSLDGLGYRLVRLRYQVLAGQENNKKDHRLKKKKPQPTGQLQLMIERLDGVLVGIKDCSVVHRQVSALLDVADPIENTFQLEVSSAGMLRPLTRNSDFTDFSGHRVEVQLGQIVNNRRRFKGLLCKGESSDSIVIEQDDEACFNVLLEDIAEARILMSPKLEEMLNNIDNT